MAERKLVVEDFEVSVKEAGIVLQESWSGDEFADYRAKARRWARDNVSKVEAVFAGNDKFWAGLDSYNCGELSYGGFIHRVFGNPGHLLIPALGWEGSREVVRELAARVCPFSESRQKQFREAFPLLYEFYDPESYGLEG